jgi:hypothetical protein
MMAQDSCDMQGSASLQAPRRALPQTTLHTPPADAPLPFGQANAGSGTRRAPTCADSPELQAFVKRELQARAHACIMPLPPEQQRPCTADRELSFWGLLRSSSSTVATLMRR